MGNKVCCDESRTQHTVLEQVQPEVVNRSAIKEPEPSYSPQPTYQPEPKEEYIPIPELTQKANLRLSTERFFFNELQSQDNPKTRRYGEDIYVGQINESTQKPNGLGRMYKPNGSIYIGYFENGRAQGRGVFIFEDGSYYEGDFNRNYAETNKGTFRSDMLSYTGGFRDNTFDGEAYQEGRDYKFVGWYSCGVRQRGTLTWYVEGKEYRYEGQFNSLNQFQGKGVLQEPTGRYQGQFVNGEKDGQGIYYAENGTRYEGNYSRGYREGFGTIYNGDNSIAYKGELSMGLPHGKGSVYKNGKEMVTTWVEGIDSNMLPTNRY